MAPGTAMKVRTAWARCLINGAHEPSCNFTLNAESRASGLAQITRVPDASIKFVSCGIYMDGTVVNSTTCFQVGEALHRRTAHGTCGIPHGKGKMPCKANNKHGCGWPADGML